jgi:hypothetical protein
LTSRSLFLVCLFFFYFLFVQARGEEATAGRSEATKRLETALEEKRALEVQLVTLTGKAAFLEQTVLSYKTKGADVLVQV